MYKAKLNDREISLEITRPGFAAINGQEVSFDISPLNTNRWHLIAGNRSFEISVLQRTDRELSVLINNRPYTLSLADEFDMLLDKMGMSVGDAEKINELKAPMPGLVVSVQVAPGDTVKKGDTLLILEAMKMENAIKAVGDATVRTIHVGKSNTVEKNQLLISFE